MFIGKKTDKTFTHILCVQWCEVYTVHFASVVDSAAGSNKFKQSSLREHLLVYDSLGHITPWILGHRRRTIYWMTYSYAVNDVPV